MAEETPRKKFYVTTPIYYVNARPHIGHAYSTIVADVLARRHRLLGEETYFLTGTDEHGQKIERSAEAAGVAPQEFADGVSKTFRDLWKRMGITNDDFIRTTEPRHVRGVQELFATLYERGHIYLSTYTGQYSIGEEMFVEGPPGTIGPDGRPTETVTEENFFFRLSAFEKPLIELIESDTLRITPESSKNEVLSFVRGGLKDLSVSRSSFTWGIPVPEEVQREAGATQKHVVYVWLDALANYMTAVGYGDAAKADLFARWWPADLHLVGKEITRFHCVYWPAFLLALNPAARFVGDVEEQKQVPFGNDNQNGKGKDNGEKQIPFGNDNQEGRGNGESSEWARKWLPKQVTANGWLLFDNSKMSKSKGNVVRTETILDGFGDYVYGKQFPESSKEERDLFASDVLRYFLLREIPFGQDGSFSFEAMVTRYNADLANGYGNLVSRTLAMIHQYFSGVVQAPQDENDPCLELLPAAEAANPWYFGHPKFLAQTARNVELQLSRAFESHQVVSLNDLYSLIASTDTLLSATRPWKKDLINPEERALVANVLYWAAECIRLFTAAIYPVLPFAASKTWYQLGLGDIEVAARKGSLVKLKWGGLKAGTELGPLGPIFPRADKSLAEVMMEMEVVTPLLANGAKDGAPGGSGRMVGLGVPSGAATNFGGEGSFMPTEDTSQERAIDGTHPAAPLKDQSTPTPGLEVAEDATYAAAAPRSSSPATEDAGGQVAAGTTERVGPAPHGEAAGSGGFAQTAGPGVTGSPEAAQIGIEDFMKVDLRVAQIVVAERIPKADKLLRLEVDLGYERRQILSGIAEWYTPEELVGRKIVIVANLAPRKMRGLESRGMLLAASEGEGGRPVLATFGEEIAVGTRLR